MGVVQECGEVNVPMAENASVRREKERRLSLFAEVKSEWVSQQMEGGASPKVNSSKRWCETGEDGQDTSHDWSAHRRISHKRKTKDAGRRK